MNFLAGGRAIGSPALVLQRTDPVVNVLKTKRLECSAAIARSLHFRGIASTCSRAYAAPRGWLMGKPSDDCRLYMGLGLADFDLGRPFGAAASGAQPAGLSKAHDH